MPGLTRQRVAVVTAALLIVLALGLPWTADTSAYLPGWYSPGFCTPDADGLVFCTGGTISPGLWVGSGALSGASSVARVFLVGALVLLVVGSRSGQHLWLALAGGGLALSVLLVGLQAQGGQVAASAAAALLLYAALSASDSRAAAPPRA